MRLIHIKLILLGFAIFAIALFLMLIYGEYETMIAWTIMIISLGLPLIISLKTVYLSIRIIFLIIFFTQFITLPFLYLAKDQFAWGHVKAYTFTGVEVSPIMFKIFIFMLSILIVSYVAKIIKYSFRKSYLAEGVRIPIPKPCYRHNNNLSRYDLKSPIYLLLVIIAISPLNLWMFNNGISIVGVEPPQLPYHLSGIMHYLTKYIIPAFLAYIYWKTKQGIIPIGLMLAYSILLGMTSVSRSSLLFVALPVITLAWVNRQRIIFITSSIVIIIFYGVVTLFRRFVVLVGGEGVSFSSDINIETLIQALVESEYSLFFVIEYAVSMFNRIDGFKNMIMAQFYDPSQVLSPVGLLLRMVWRPFAPMDLDAHHIQWQGGVLPEGFVNGGALLSNMIIIGNYNIFWVIAYGILVSVIMIFLESLVNKLSIRYSISYFINRAIIGFMTIIFFIEGGGSNMFVFFVIFLFLILMIPKVKIKNMLC